MILRFRCSPLSSAKRWKFENGALTGTLNSAATERITSIRQNPLLLDIARRGDENSDRLHEKTPRFDGIPHHRHHLQELGWALEASRRVLLKEHLKENDERLRDTFELFNRQGRR